jgi:hypothetical protein
LYLDSGGDTRKAISSPGEVLPADFEPELLADEDGV